MSKFTPMLLKEKERYRSLGTDLARFENTSDYYRTYKIPDDEEMLVYAYSSGFSSFSMEGNGTIITDRAIYFHPTHTDWAPKNRIELSGLCSYFIFQENSLDTVHLLNSASDLTIFGRTVAPNDTTGQELVQLLRGIQRQMALSSSEDKSSYESAEGFILDSIGRAFRSYGVLTPLYSALLDALCEEGAFPSMTTVYKAENLYRLCDRGAYYSYIESISDDMPEKLVEALNDPDKRFFSDYTDDLFDASTFTFTNSLLPVYSNLSARQYLTLPECIILMYISSYMGDEEYVLELFSTLGDDLPMAERLKIMSFVAKQKNEQMTKVYDRLLSGVMPRGKEWDYRDSTGLTALHYAIILKDPVLIRQVLSERDWSSDVFRTGAGKLVDTVYDYFFEASLLFRDPELLTDIYCATRRAARPLVRSIRRLDTLIEINEKLFEADGEEEHNEKIREYISLRDEIHGELVSRVMSDALDERDKMHVIYETKHTFACYMVSVILDSDRIFANLAETAGTFRVYRFRDRWFITPAQTKLDLYYVLWQDGEITGTASGDATDEFSPDGPDMGKNYENPAFKKASAGDTSAKKRAEKRSDEAIQSHRFFSDEACVSITVLKKEYHELVKKYHPDAAGETYDSDIIRAIYEERAEILETIRA